MSDRIGRWFFNGLMFVAIAILAVACLIIDMWQSDREARFLPKD